MSLISGLVGLFKKIFSNKSSAKEIPQNVIVYRAMRSGKWWDEDALYNAFFLRPNEKELSLLTSVDCKTEAECELKYCAAIRFKDCYGEIGLAVQHFNDLGYVVIESPDYDDPPIPHHASVPGMPSPNEEKARSDALELAEKVTFKKKRRYKRK